jgi:tetratricopeptide (TPR) repeat protein
MVMQKIRRSKKTMRVPLIIMTIVLAVGLVGSFAIWSAPNVNPAGQQTQATPEQQIENLQLSIDSWEESLKENPKDFGLLNSLADIRYDQADLYMQIGNREKGKEVFTKSLENYLAALDNVPEELNEKGKANIMVKAAGTAWYAGQESTADIFYEEAIKLVPDDWATRNNYAIYLALFKRDFAAAKTELEGFKSGLAADDPTIGEVDQMITALEEIEKAATEPAETESEAGSESEKSEDKK